MEVCHYANVALAMLERILCRQFRNLHLLDLTLAEPCTIIYGDNGEGKTAVLEAIYAAICGKSFRAPTLDTMIQHDHDGFSVYLHPKKDIFPGFGLVKDRGKTSEILTSSADKLSRLTIASAFPVLYVSPESFQVVSGGPDIRRNLVHWLMFHVEPSYFKLWSQYGRALKHRNQLLKDGDNRSATFTFWTDMVVSLGDKVNDLREVSISEYLKMADSCLKELNLPLSPSTEYYPGWDINQSDLASEMCSNLAYDSKYKHTKAGPHRFDIRLTARGKAAKYAMSRGQQKLMQCAFFLAAMQLVKLKTKSPLLLLWDDISSEFDQKNQQVILSQISSLDRVQSIISTISVESAQFIAQQLGGNVNMFHVKQLVSEVA